MADFVTRHVGTWGVDQQTMLDVIGIASTDELMRRAMPSSIVSAVAGAQLPEALSEASSTEHRAYVDGWARFL